MKQIQKKGQFTLEDAPTMVMTVGLVFLIMATMALVGQKYGVSLTDRDSTASVTNETLTTVEDKVGEGLYYGQFDNSACTLLAVTNASSGTLLTTANYTQTNCRLKSSGANGANNSNWNVTYTAVYDKPTVATNVTSDLQTEISNNTSIAGIVLTISLVGIVLSILIGVFVGIRGRTRI